MTYTKTGTLAAFGWTDLTQLPSLVYLGSDRDAAESAIQAASGTYIYVELINPFSAGTAHVQEYRFGTNW
jgi:hypothetical protein